jgi:membrane protease YdiL (CAAX protease family)
MSEPENSPVRSTPPIREGTLPAQRVRWGLPDAAIVLALGTVLVALNAWLISGDFVPKSDLLRVVISGLFYALLLVCLFIVARRRGLGSLKRDFGFELRWIDLLIGVGLVIALQVANVIVYDFAIHVLGLPNENVSNVTLPKSRALAIFDALVVASVFAPIVEELVFRGLLMRAVRNFVIRRAKFEGPSTTRRAQRVSILVSAMVFAAAHLYEAQNLTMLFVLGVSIFIFGLVAGAVATRTGRLGPSIMIHMLTNGLATVLLLSSR